MASVHMYHSKESVNMSHQEALVYALQTYFGDGLLQWTLGDSNVSFTLAYRDAIELSYDYMQIHRLPNAENVTFVLCVTKKGNLELQLPALHCYKNVDTQTPIASIGRMLYCM